MSIDFHEFVCKITEVHWCTQIKVMYIYIDLICRNTIKFTISPMYNLTGNPLFKVFLWSV